MTLTELKAWIAANIFTTKNRMNSGTSVRELLNKVAEETYGRATEMEAYAQGLMTDYPNRFPGGATQLYVSEAGNDANPGTRALPLRTLARAAALVNWKFRLVTINFTGASFTHNVDVDFFVENLELRLYDDIGGYAPTIFNASKYTSTVGAYTYDFLRRISNSWGSIYIYGQYHNGVTRGNIVVPALAAFPVGGDDWLYKRSRSLFQAGTLWMDFPTTIQVMTANINLGANAIFASGPLGDNYYHNRRVCFKELDSVWTLGAGALKRSTNTVSENIRPEIYTPTGSSDVNMGVGITMDNNFLYVKTEGGTVKKIALVNL